MVRQEERGRSAGRVQLLRGQGGSEKPDMQDNTVKGSQFKQPMLEFSGSCAGCAETSYARLDHPAVRRPDVHLQRHRLLLHLGRACRNLSVHASTRNGHGPAWANSLFEDNAEHGLGMYLGQKAIRNRLADKTRAADRRGVGASRAEGSRSEVAGHHGRRRCQRDRRRLRQGAGNSIAPWTSWPACEQSRPTARN